LITTVEGSAPVQDTGLNAGIVQVIVACPASPITMPTPVHLPDGRAGSSKEICAANARESVVPLIAPDHSAGLVAQLPSTQLPLCTMSIVIVRAAKFDDSIVPIHLPAILAAGGPGTSGGLGVAGGFIEPQAEWSSPSTMTTRVVQTRRTTRDGIATRASVGGTRRIHKRPAGVLFLQKRTYPVRRSS
jgi:hypothetical protein